MLHILIVHQTEIIYSIFTRLHHIAAEIFTFKTAKKCTRPTTSQLCIVLKELRPRQTTMTPCDSSFVHKKWRLYLIANISKTASENRAHINKVSCLHIHCAVVNCCHSFHMQCVKSTPATVLAEISQPPARSLAEWKIPHQKCFVISEIASFEQSEHVLYTKWGTVIQVVYPHQTVIICRKFHRCT